MNPAKEHASNPSELWKRITAIAMSIALVMSPSCGDADEDGREVPTDDPPGEFRDGGVDNAQQIANEVAGLRAQPTVLAASAEIGALPGESSVDAAGQAHYTIPIEVVPGPRGMQPAIAVEYASNDGNGALGNRFDLAGFSAIHRCPATPAQDGAFERIGYDGDDPLCFDGERLILVAGEHGSAGAEYRARRNPFERIVLDDAMGSFGGEITVSHSDGQVSRFGGVPASLWVGHTGSAQTPWRWAIRQTCDRWNNCIDYEYEHGPDLGNGPSDLRVVAVRYGGTGTPASRRAVEIAWDDRDDTAFQYVSGALLQRSKVVTGIDVLGPSDVLVRRYGFDYTPHAQTGRLRLTAARMCDAAGACLPDTTFEWSQDASSTLALDPWESEGQGGVVNLADEMTELLEARAIVVGDFDGRGDDELLFPTDLEGNPWLLWFTPNADFDTPQATPRVWIPSIDDMLPPEVSGSPENLGEFIDYLGEITPPFRPAAVNFGGSVRDDVLIPVGEAWASGGNGTDSAGFVIAEQLAFFADVSPNGVGGAYVIEDDSDDPIYQIVPIDHDGDLLTDVWMCRGPAHDEGVWTLAHRVGTAANQEDAYEFIETDIACSAYDEWTVSSVDGGPASLLVIPAYDEDGEHLASENRSDYRRIRLDIGTGTSSLEVTGLPRDIYQRTHDALCRNGVVESGLVAGPLLGAGRSHDHQVDLNDDGLVDVLRFELAEGDGVANLDAIRAGLLTVADANDILLLVGNDPWESASLCSDDPDLEQDAVIATYYNTGAGFVRGPNAVELSGNAHAQFWLNFVGAISFDLSDDGRTDLIMPAMGPGTGWTALLASADGVLSVTDLGDDLEGWPSYDSDATWHEDMALGQKAYVAVLGGPSGRRPSLAFVGVIEDAEAFPTPVNLYRATGSNGASTAADRIELITNGVGARVELSYDPKWLPTQPSAAWPKASLTEGVWVTTRHAETVNPAGELRTRNYSYADAEIDRTGRGLLGFRRVEIADGPIRTITTYAQAYDDDLGDYPHRGRPRERLVIKPIDAATGSSHVNRTLWTWGTRHFDEVGGTTYFTFPELVDEMAAVTSCDEAGWCGDFDSSETYFRKNTTQTVDDYGTVLTSIETYTDGEGPVTQVSNTEIVHDEQAWILGMVGKTTAASCRNGTCADRVILKSHEPLTGAVDMVTLQPDDPQNELVTEFHRDARGNVDGITQTADDGSGSIQSRVTTTMWDVEGAFPLHTTNSLGHRSYVVHDAASGVLLASVDAAGLTTKTAYDGMYRVVRTSVHGMPLGADDGAPTAVEYLAEDPAIEHDVMRVRNTTTAGQQTTEFVSASGHVVRQQWRGMASIGPVLTEGIPGGTDVFVAFEYDHRGRRVSRTVPAWVDDPAALDRKYERSFDALDRVTSQTAPDGALLETREYHHNGVTDHFSVDLHTTQGATQLVETAIVDALGLPLAQIDAAGVRACFEHGPFEQLSKVVRNCNTANFQESKTEYDDGGRVIEQRDPALGTRTSIWNAFGELIQQEDAEGRVTKYRYDPLGRLHERIDGDGTASFVYDTLRLGALSRDLSPDGVERNLTYDGFGRTKTATTKVSTPSGSDDYKFEYTYGPGGRLDTIAYPRPDNEAALTIRYTYDAVGHLRGVRNVATGLTPWVLRSANPSAMPTRETYGNDAETWREYDADRLWVEQIRHTTPQGTFADLRYTWLPQGELDKREDLIAQQAESFTYDTKWRLTGAKVTNAGGDFPRWFGYDDHGNLTSMTDVGTYKYDAQGRLTEVGGVGVTMDDSGNLIKHGSKQLTYTAFGKLRSAQDGAVNLTMAYDAQGERVRKRQAGALVPDTVTLGTLYERKVRGNGLTASMTYRIAAGDRIVSQIVRQPFAGGGFSESLQYVHDDHLGSTVLVTSKANNVVTKVASSSSDAWGRARVADKWHSWQDDPAEIAKLGVGFTGHRAEQDLGLIDMGGRMYDPRIAKFTTADPLVADPYDGAAYNRYAYVGNRPLRFTDPTGWAADGDAGETDEDVAADDGGESEASFDAFIAWLASHPSGAAIANALGMGGALLNEMYELGLKWKELGVETLSGVYEIAKLIATDRNVAAMVVAEIAKEGVRTSIREVRHHASVVANAYETAYHAFMSGDLIRANNALIEAIPSSYALAGIFVTGGGVRALKALRKVVSALRSKVSVKGVIAFLTSGGRANASSRILGFTPRLLQKGFTKHGADFGLTGSWNPSRAADFSAAVNQHINKTSIKVIPGKYRGDPAIHYFDKDTNLNVVSDLDGNYITGFRLSSTQAANVANGWL